MNQLPSSVRDETYVISTCSRKIVAYIISLLLHMISSLDIPTLLWAANWEEISTVEVDACCV